MTITFRPAERTKVSLLIGIAGGTGSGKTYSAMRLASGIAGTRRFAVIDTEAGRASHYANQFVFDVAELSPPFSPAAYEEAILAADAAGYPVIVVDSMSHEWAGDGGILDMQEAEFTRMGSREGAKMASWIKPKMQHKQMMQKLLQIRAHLILCFRAEQKIEIIKDEKGKTQIVPKESLTGLDGWIPVTEKTVPFELTASFLMTADAPGYPKPIKLQEQHRALFPLDHPIDEQSGQLVAHWATGGKPPAVSSWADSHRDALRLAPTLDELRDARTSALAAAKARGDSDTHNEFKAMAAARKSKLEASPLAEFLRQISAAASRDAAQLVVDSSVDVLTGDDLQAVYDAMIAKFPE
jgi:hypothetical protein